MSVRILQGDCLDVLKTLPDESVDSIVTDPPYGLKFMGKKWDHGVPGMQFWLTLLRLAKPGAHLLAFGGSRTFHRLWCAVEDAGWEIRDTLMWLHGEGFPKSSNQHGEWEGWGTALKPAFEPILMARKSLIGTIAENLNAHRTGALNIDACRVPVDASDASQLRTMDRSKRTEDTAGQKWGLSKNGGDSPQVVRPEGRWPANVLHDGSEEVVAAFPEAPGQMGNVTGKEPSTPAKNVYGTYTRNVAPNLRGDSGSAARFFWCPKASKQDRNEGCEGLPLREGGIRSETSGQRITRRDGGAPGLVENHHPTVKPTELMQYLCKLVTAPGGGSPRPVHGQRQHRESRRA